MENKIFNNDFFNILPKIKKHSVDLVVVDLPYNSIELDWDKQPIDLGKMWRELVRIGKPNTYYIFFCSSRFGYNLIKSKENYYRYDLVYEKAMAVGFLCAKKKPLIAHEMIYIFRKPIETNDREKKLNLTMRAYSQKIVNYINKKNKEITKDLGHMGHIHFLTPNGEQYGYPTEKTYNELIKLYNIDKMDGFIKRSDFPPLEKIKSLNNKYNVIKKQGFKPYKSSYNDRPGTQYGTIGAANIINTDGSRFPRSVLKYNLDKEKIHPTQKPVALCEFLIEAYSDEGDLVLDHTMGSGSTIVAAINKKRQYIGIEKDKDIFKKADERIKKTLKKSLKINI